jgi:hydrogenase nickel incorporation protein HypA/HybF
MHELGVVFSIMDRLQEVADANQVDRISKVTIDLGEVTTVIPSYLTNCWKWAVKKSELLSGAELEIKRVPAITYCENCGNEYETVKYGKICPKCGSSDTWLLQGNEFMIRDIEVPEQGDEIENKKHRPQ